MGRIKALILLCNCELSGRGASRPLSWYLLHLQSDIAKALNVMSLTVLQRRKLHASIFSYLAEAEGGAFSDAAAAFKKAAALTEEDAHLVADGALEAKWKTKRQLEIDLLKVKEWVKGQVPYLPPLLGDTEADDGHATSTGEDGAVRDCPQGSVDDGTTPGTTDVISSGTSGTGTSQRLRRQCVEFTCSAFPRWGNTSRDVFGCDEHKLAGMVDLRRRNCEALGCGKGAGFGFEGDTMRFCSSHKERGMVNLRGKRCEAPGCRRHPLYGHEGQRRRFCKSHREQGMVYKVGNTCRQEGCLRPARFAMAGDDAKLCMEHKLEGMIDVHHRLCEEPNCKIGPSFAYEGEKARFCLAHKKEMMVNVSQRRCEHENCRRQPLWGWAGEQRARVCGSHKTPGMENIHVKRCEAIGCRKQPNFGSPTDRVRRFCKEHKTQSCVNVSTKPCEYPGCGAGARCGYDDQAAVYCRAHRTEGMRVVQRRVCLEPGCDKLPSYGYEVDRKRLYCAQHRLAGMTSLQRKCQADGCQTEPQFNFAGMRPPKFCQKHKADGMMDVVSRKCQVEGCLKRPWYSYDGTRSVLCAEHKSPGMVGYRPPQKNGNSGAVDVGGIVGGVVGGIVGGVVGGVVGEVVGLGGAGRKRTFTMMSMQHHEQHHVQPQPDHNGSADLVHDSLDPVGLGAISMGEEEGLQEARALGLDGMGGVDLVQPRLGEHGLEHGLEHGEGSLEADAIAHGALDPTGIGHPDLGPHQGLEHRELEPGGLDVGGGHVAHDITLEPVLPAHAAHPGTLVDHTDKLFR